MQFFQQVWLLASLVLCLHWAGAAEIEANMDIWTVDRSCTDYHQDSGDVSHLTGGPDLTADLQKHLTSSAQIAAYALSRLKIAQNKRPDKMKNPVEYKEWVRIVKTMTAVFGIDPQVSSLTGRLKTSQWKNLLSIYKTVATTLPASENKPPHGYDKKLFESVGPNSKPMIVCGDNWQWLVLATDMYPGRNIRLIQDPDLHEKIYLRGARGAWFKAERMVFLPTSKPIKPIICQPGISGYASFKYDMIGICDNMIEYRGDILERSEAKEGDDIGLYLASFQGVLLNQLFKWYSGKHKATGDWRVRDQQAVDESGKLLYQTPEGEIVAYETEVWLIQQQRHLEVVLAADTPSIYHLARIHPRNPYSGPSVATLNPSSLTAFALMMWFDKYDWSSGGKAKLAEQPPGYDE